MLCKNNYYINKLYQKFSTYTVTQIISSGSQFTTTPTDGNNGGGSVNISISTVEDYLSTISNLIVIGQSTNSNLFIDQTNIIIEQTNTISNDIRNQTVVLKDAIDNIRPDQKVIQTVEVNIDLKEIKEYLSSLVCGIKTVPEPVIGTDTLPADRVLKF